MAVDLDVLWKVLESQATWIRYAERKAMAIFALTIGVAGALATALRALPTPGTPGTITFIIALIGQVFTAVVTCTVLAPRTTHHQPRHPGHDVIYFGDITAAHRSGRGVEEYATHLHATVTDPDTFARITARQIHALALIAERKLRFTRLAMISLALTTIATITTLIIWAHQ